MKINVLKACHNNYLQGSTINCEIKITPNLHMSTITAESCDTVGTLTRFNKITCIRLLVLQRVWGRSLGGRYPITESSVLCFRAPSC